MKMIIGSTSQSLGKSIACNFNIRPSTIRISRFADGEINVEVEHNLSSEEVYVIHSTSPPVNDSMIELLLIIDAIKRIGVDRITAIIPYCGYSRQDRIIKNDNMQSALSAQLIANLIEVAGVERVAIVELHSCQSEGFFKIPVTNLNCLEMFADFVQLESLAIVAPDVGAIKRARAFAKILEEKHRIQTLSNKIIVIDKYRESSGISQVMNVIGEVRGKNCVIVDDIIDSGGTLCNAAFELKNRGAKSVTACIVHGVLSGNAIEKINLSSLDKLIITDTISHKLSRVDKIEVMSVSEVLTNFILKNRRSSNVH